MRKLAALLGIIIAVSYLSGVAAAHDYVGADKCKTCHNSEAKGKIYDVWMKTAHAKTYETLVAKGDGSERKAECLTCHTTGYGKPTGFSPADSTLKLSLASVGCESCHGAGADYKAMAVMKDPAKAKEAGLMMPTAESCKTCHNEKSPTFKGFDYAEYWKKIEHKTPAATK